MHPTYIDAVETRLRWLEWARSGGMRESWAQDRILEGAPDFRYHSNLEYGDLFVMEKEFCRLVEHARQQVPDTLVFDQAWLHAPRGWMWLAEPFKTPEIGSYRKMREKEPDLTARHIPEAVGTICAIGWYPIAVGQGLQFQDGTRGLAGEGCYGFLCYNPFRARTGFRGFTPFSYFTLTQGDALGERLALYEEQASNMLAMTLQKHGHNTSTLTFSGQYDDPVAMWKHEMRWAYAALHLMAQKLAVSVPRPLDRATRRRADRAKQTPPPFVRAITLRRLEAARTRDPKGNEVDWQWQWEVSGHYRNQWYAEEGIHKEIFIEAYVKGPPGKPFKSTGLKLFVARR